MRRRGPGPGRWRRRSRTPTCTRSRAARRRPRPSPCRPRPPRESGIGAAMSSRRAFVHVVRAGFLERVRRHGFLVTLVVTLWFAYLSLPPNGAHYITLQVAEHRAGYGSAWVGAVVSMLAATLLSLAGFFLVKNAIARDRATGVGQILATTPIGKPLYTLGKAGSNFAVLATMTRLPALGALGMHVLRGEGSRIDVVALFAAFVIGTL